MANSVKHGFADGREGEIRVRLTGEGPDGFVLHCSDNGMGDKTTLERVAAEKGLGSRVVDVLARSLAARRQWSSDGQELALELRSGV